MGITYHEASGCFKLDAGSTSYVIGIMGGEQYAMLLYYGPYVPDGDLRELYGPYYDFRPSVYPRDKARYMDAFRFEYPVCGCGDFREHCLEVETAAGHRACELHYVSHRISKGKEPLRGLPATYGNGDAFMTLELILQDPVISVDVKLTYTVFEKLDVITRSVQVINNAGSPLALHRVLSACIDLPHRDLDILTLHGGWENECTPVRASVTSGRYVCESTRGESSAQANSALRPLLGLRRKNESRPVRGADVHGVHEETGGCQRPGLLEQRPL